MQKFVLDTGIVLGYVRAAGYAEYVEKKYGLFNPPNIPLISIVSKGEIYSLAIQFQWGTGKLKTLDELLRKLPVVDVNDDQILHRYAEIDAYSWVGIMRDRFREGRPHVSWGKTIFGSLLLLRS